MADDSPPKLGGAARTVRLLLLFVALGLALLWRAGFGWPGSRVPRNVTGQIVDETGQPVAGVGVKLVWHADAVLGNKPNALAEHHKTQFTSDANGRLSVEGGISCDLTATKDGYHPSMLSLPPKLQGDSFVIPLKRIRHPQPMVGKQVTLRIPIGGSRLQYDFLAGDCLPPLGKGVVADLEIEWTRPGNKGREAIPRAFKPRIIGSGNGAIPPATLPTLDLQGHSRLSSLHEAPADGYGPDCDFEYIMRGAPKVAYIKIRNGQPGGPLYGKMLGPIYYLPRSDFDWFQFVYVVNPSGDRGLEMDMGHLAVPAKQELEYPPNEF